MPDSSAVAILKRNLKELQEAEAALQKAALKYFFLLSDEVLNEPDLCDVSDIIAQARACEMMDRSMPT